jgi:uncharacterized protein YjbJ (UPF0337 family)
MSSMSNKVSGKSKELAGKLTGNTKMKVEGKIQAEAADTKMKTDTFGENIKVKAEEMKHRSDR